MPENIPLNRKLKIFAVCRDALGQTVYCNNYSAFSDSDKITVVQAGKPSIPEFHIYASLTAEVGDEATITISGLPAIGESLITDTLDVIVSAPVIRPEEAVSISIRDCGLIPDL